MKAFTKHKGIVAVMDRINVDTDQIIPKQFLKRIERTGYGEFLFYDWRFDENGDPQTDFDLNQPRFHGASILVAGANFGCGSSREHASWALLDYGFRAIIAPSFSDIFYNNCFQNGMLPVRIAEKEVRSLMELGRSVERYALTIDLNSQTISDENSLKLGFGIDPFRRECLLRGLDEIGLTLLLEKKIVEYENVVRASRPHSQTD